MSSISDKLKSLGVQVGAENIQPPAREEGHTRLVDVLPGRWQETPHGEAFVVQKTYPADFQQGDIPLRPVAPFDVLGDWAKSPALPDLPLETLAFIDTETTGLSGGAGTYTFLIGVGRFVGDEFHLAQFFMRDPAEEAAQLAALEAHLAPCRAVVSYNGKSFDMPRLKTRYIAHGWPPPLEDVAHVDLLHLVRRIWRERLPSRALGDIEFHILGFERAGEDVPGWQVADFFFDYLRTGDARPLTRVFYHNEADVVSLAALLNRASAMLAHPLGDEVQHPLEMMGIGKLFTDLGYAEKASQVYQRALENKDLSPEAYWRCLKELSFVHKRDGRLERAMTLWEEAAQDGQPYAHVELAKVHEHARKDYAEALHWTLAAIEHVNQGAYSQYLREEWLAKLGHRLERLKRRLANQQ
ncbi:MAG: hypothetical protein MAG431_02120 [Chloroflexi bacterium]|nr:hypothetical protein [Chloroflexota bacterium]